MIWFMIRNGPLGADMIWYKMIINTFIVHKNIRDKEEKINEKKQLYQNVLSQILLNTMQYDSMQWNTMTYDSKLWNAMQ